MKSLHFCVGPSLLQSVRSCCEAILRQVVSNLRTGVILQSSWSRSRWHMFGSSVFLQATELISNNLWVKLFVIGVSVCVCVEGKGDRGFIGMTEESNWVTKTEAIGFFRAPLQFSSWLILYSKKICFILASLAKKKKGWLKPVKKTVRFLR